MNNKKVGPKIRINFNIYNDNKLICEIKGSQQSIKYIKENLNLELTQTQFTSMCRCYSSDNYRLKKKHFKKFHSVEIERIGD